MNPERDLAVYVHWPFCASKCPYCDFNSHARDAVDQECWRNAYASEIAATAALVPDRQVTSIFFGGGTPSRMEPATVGAVLDAIARAWRLDSDAEITLEANPNSSDAERFAGFRAVGVNRLSIGVQAFDDAALRFLGRTHDSATARRTLETAAAIFPRFTFDLMSALPGQSVEAWNRELDIALAFAPEHLSVYQLTIEPGTAFGRERVETAGEDDAVATFEATQARLNAAGLPAYEVSNHAKPGAESRHNLTYWQGGDYAGIGPGAHGRLTIEGTAHATRRPNSPDRWLEQAGRRPDSVPLDDAERRAEMVMTGLRLSEGIDRAAFRARTGVEPEDAMDADAVKMLAEEGLLISDARGVRVPAAHRLLLNAILGRLLA